MTKKKDTTVEKGIYSVEVLQSKILREHYDKSKSLTWIELPNGELMLIAVNYCFVNRIAHIPELVLRGIKFQLTHSSNGDYALTEFRFFPVKNKIIPCRISNGDMDVIEAYFNMYENRIRDEVWGKLPTPDESPVEKEEE